jgi:tetratricopeptide (TPR) repeat protein
MSRFSGLLIGIALGVAVAFACGPFFGIEVLQNRREVLLAAPTISFEAELKALVPPPKDKLPVAEINARGEDPPDAQAIEAKDLPPAVLARVSAMRSQNSGEAAYGLGQDLPPAIQLYTAGAVGFSHGDSAAARSYFQKILELPEQERKSRDVWAHFMLGRIAIQESNQTEAAAQFEAVRALVRNGAADPLGLAVGSLGEQAGGAWKQGAVANAVELYARQASYGSQSGANSLVMLAGRILDDRNLLEQGVRDQLTRRLLFICLNANSGRLFFVGPDTSDGGAAKVDRLVAALESQGLTHVEGAGLLASAAYSQGRFDVAQKLSALEDVAISFWVQAKLALRRGDTQTALEDYEKALKTFQPSMGDPASLMAEHGVVRVSRGDYVQALDLFNRATAKGWGFVPEYDGFTDYWGDAAYLAERVLTIDELRDYLSHQSTGRAASQISRLRSVLARRLMRAGRRQEALRYFDDAKIRNKAEQYNSALDTANSWWHLPLTRAEAWFTAAKLARDSGMELLSFEKEPDYAIWNGEFEFNGGGGEDSKLSEDERRRVAASKPERDVRFQYRLTAVDQAMKSADFLPARSQPFAAVLCEATVWTIDREPERAKQVYDRYLHQGAHVAWGRSFGRTCPQPDFAEVSTWSKASRGVNHLVRHARAHRLYSALAAFLALAIVTAVVLYRRRINA